MLTGDGINQLVLNKYNFKSYSLHKSWKISECSPYKGLTIYTMESH